jgi:hypothetical protein
LRRKGTAQWPQLKAKNSLKHIVAGVLLVVERSTGTIQETEYEEA